MQIERLKNSQLLKYFKIDETKEWDVILKKEKDATAYISIYCNIPIIGNIENKLVYEKLAEFFTYIDSNFKIELILYFSTNVQYFTLSLLQTLFSYVYNDRYVNKILLKFVGNINKSSSIMAQMLYAQYLTNNFIENISVYTVNDSGSILKWSRNPKGQYNLPSITKYVISDEFSPIITIKSNGNNSFEYFFKKDVSELIVNRSEVLRSIIKEKKTYRQQTKLAKKNYLIQSIIAF